MATIRDDEKTAALDRARSAHGRLEMAEKWREVRNEELLAAFVAGATLTEIAEALGMSQQEVSSILRSGPEAGPD